MKHLIWFILPVMAMIGSCKQEKRQETAPVSNEQLTDMNRNFVRREGEMIDAFIRRHNFKTQQTGTGLRFQMLKQGTGKNASMKDVVTVSYRRYFLDGELIDSVSVERPVSFMLGVSDQPRGLEEGLMLMNKGSIARMIIPSHLAYGLSGDGGSVAPGNSLYYEVELLDIRNE